MALGLVQPVTGGLADDFLSKPGHIAVSNVDKLLQGRGVAEVSEMEAETLSQDLDRGAREIRAKTAGQIMQSTRSKKPTSSTPTSSNILLFI